MKLIALIFTSRVLPVPYALCWNATPKGKFTISFGVGVEPKAAYQTRTCACSWGDNL